MYTVLVDEAKAGLDSRQLLKHLAAQRIQTRPLWQPLHRSPAHDFPATMPCPVSDELYRQALSLPCSVGLTQADQNVVIKAIMTRMRF
jgi:dTDP-4-amino-4,6-dideoxygalactose transaminase